MSRLPTLACLRVHFELLVMFDIVDDSDDGEINFDEFVCQIPEIKKWGVKVTDARATFDEIDGDRKGTLGFDEFREWALLKHLDLEDDDEDAAANTVAHDPLALHARSSQKRLPV